MLPKLNLGIVRNKERSISHRSLLKVVCNPFLRTLGFMIATIVQPKLQSVFVDEDEDEVVGISLIRVPKSFDLISNLRDSWIYELEPDEFVIKSNRLW